MVVVFVVLRYSTDFSFSGVVYDQIYVVAMAPPSFSPLWDIMTRSGGIITCLLKFYTIDVMLMTPSA